MASLRIRVNESTASKSLRLKQDDAPRLGGPKAHYTRGFKNCESAVAAVRLIKSCHWAIIDTSQHGFPKLYQDAQAWLADQMIKVISFLVALITMLMTTAVQSKILIKIDLDSQRLSATKASGEMVVWKISSGRSGYETPIGHFSVMRMEKDHHSDEYDQAPMPYALFFSPRGLAIHGTFEKGLGRPASHGCVRLAVPHAQQLYNWVEEEGGAQVDIIGSTQAAGRRSVPPAATSANPPLRRSVRPEPPESAQDDVESVWRF